MKTINNAIIRRRIATLDTADCSALITNRHHPDLCRHANRRCLQPASIPRRTSAKLRQENIFPARFYFIPSFWYCFSGYIIITYRIWIIFSLICPLYIFLKMLTNKMLKLTNFVGLASFKQEKSNGSNRRSIVPLRQLPQKI